MNDATRWGSHGPNVGLALGGAPHCMSINRAVLSMHSFPMTPMKPLSEISYVPNAMVRSLGSDSDELDRHPVEHRRRSVGGGVCTLSPWWAVGGLIAIVVALLVVVLTIELRSGAPDSGVALAAGVLSVGGDPSVASTTATTATTAITSLSSNPLETSVVAPLLPTLPTTAPDQAGVVETSVVTVATRASRISLSNVIRHALGTYAVEIIVGPARAYEAYAATPGARIVLRLHGEMVGLSVIEEETATDLLEALDPGREKADLETCSGDYDDGVRVHGVYVRAVCVDGVAVPRSRTPALRCYIVIESACFAPGRGRLPLSIQHDAHNGPWVFSYTSTSTYVRRRRLRRRSR